MGKFQKAPRLVQARGYIMQVTSYFAPTLYGFIPQPVENLTEKVGGPMGISEGLVLFYDPKWVEEENELILATGLAHEILHHQLKHPERGKGKDPQIWNIAGDAYINNLLRNQKKTVTLPNGQQEEQPMWHCADWFIQPEAYDLPIGGHTVDQYYEMLLKQKQSGKLKMPASGKLGSGRCGGIAGNPISRELERGADATIGRSSADTDIIRKATASNVKKIMEGKGRGTVPASFGELIQAAEDTVRIPWEQRLASVIRCAAGRAKAGGLDYSKRRPSKRSYLRGIMLPSLIKREFEILLVIDTSGSMGSRTELPIALKEAGNVLRQTGAETAWLMEVDANVARPPYRVTSRDLHKVELHGRGGTDFCPAFEAAKTLRPRPDILIYFTDGEGTAPEHPPMGFETIWCIVAPRHHRKPAPWGSLVVASNDPKVLDPYDQD